ncbi:PilN domain-containing protein [Zavarzinia aquatilis]|nr:PilN domain-containing protein [Zavarzinia aquatilis]
MDIKALLNTDMTTLVRGLKRGLDWWAGELSALVPARFRARLTRPRLVVAIERGEPVFYRSGTGSWRRVDKPGRAAVRAALVVAPEAVLTGDFDYPVPSPGELRRMLTLDLDRLTPFAAADAVFDAEVAADPAEKGATRRITLAVMRREDLARDLALLAGKGIHPASAGLADGAGTLRFDFTRDLDGAVQARGGRLGMALRIALPVLLLANLGLLVLRDDFATVSLREAVEGQRLQVQRIEQLRRQVDREEARRRDLLDLARRQAPLPVLDAVTRALPDDAHATRFDWNGAELRLAGKAADPGALPALIDATGLFGPARPLDEAAGPPGSFGLALAAKVQP